MDRYQPIELEDLSSLAKLTWGFEEIPFPLFSFPRNDKWLVRRVYELFKKKEHHIFVMYVLDSDPNKPFLKFSPTNGSKPSFVNDPNQNMDILISK